jgi:hypothetical protein
MCGMVVVVYDARDQIRAIKKTPKNYGAGDNGTRAKIESRAGEGRTQGGKIGIMRRSKAMT